jgi:hypothetical protein
MTPLRTTATDMAAFMLAHLQYGDLGTVRLLQGLSNRNLIGL